MPSEKPGHRRHHILPLHRERFRSSAQRRVEDRERKRAKGPLGWHLHGPNRSPLALTIKNHFVAMLGEFVGTVLFLFFAFGGTNVAQIPSTSVTGNEASGQNGSTVTAPNTSSLLYIALSFGFSLAVNAWIFFRVSGGLFNPAVSLGMALVGALTPLRAILLTISQILGAIVGSAIIDALLPGTLNIRTQLAGGISTAQGLFLEMFLTAMLMLAILLLAAEKHKATFLAPIGIGLALFISELVGVYYTGGSLNPARSFGPDVVLHSFEHYHWIYWLGPILGTCLAAGFYKFIKVLEYETVLGPEDGDSSTMKPAPADLTAAAGPGTDMEHAMGGSGPHHNSHISTALGGSEPHANADEDVAFGQSGSSTNADTGAAFGSHGSSAPSSSKPAKSKTFANAGPGLGDLLTHDGDEGNPYEVDHVLTAHVDDRMDRIEYLLQQLLHGQAPYGASPAIRSRSERDSMSTLHEDGSSSFNNGKLAKPITPP